MSELGSCVEKEINVGKFSGILCCEMRGKLEECIGSRARDSWAFLNADEETKRGWISRDKVFARSGLLRTEVVVVWMSLQAT